jgi:hypothetical protein
VSIETRSTSIKGTKGPGDSGLVCDFRKTLELPVIREDNEICPQTSDAIHIRIRKSDRTPGKTRPVAASTLSLRDIMQGQWLEPVWLNLYGCPRKDAGLAAPPSSIFSGDPDNSDALLMNEVLTGPCTLWGQHVQTDLLCRCGVCVVHSGKCCWQLLSRAATPDCETGAAATRWRECPGIQHAG